MLAGMTTGESGGDSVVRITQREVYDIVLRMSSKLDRVLQEVDERSRQSDEHEGRLKALELAQAASAVKVDALRTTTEQHSLDLAKIAAAVARSAWVPSLTMLVIIAGVGAAFTWLVNR